MTVFNKNIQSKRKFLQMEISIRTSKPTKKKSKKKKKKKKNEHKHGRNIQKLFDVSQFFFYKKSNEV